MAVSQHIWHCGAGLPGDVLIADLRAYRYAPHFHDAWAIGAVEQGCCEFTVQGAPYTARAGELVVIAPGQVHTGGTAAGSLAYRMAYLDPAWFQDHEQALDAHGVRRAGPVIADASLCATWLNALTADEIPDPAALRLRLLLNGEVMQDRTNADWCFPLPRLLEWLTMAMTLEPGDVVTTGTPAGIGYFRRPQVFLKPGDVCELEIEPIGRLTNPVVADEPVRV